MSKFCKEEILKKINSKDHKNFYVVNDFLEFGSASEVGKALNSLVEEGEIKRFQKGFYHKPIFIDLLGKYSVPGVRAFVDAVSRKYNWTIVPEGNTALNLLGLDTQVPRVYWFVTDGTYFETTYGKIKMIFVPKAESDVLYDSYITATVIQALKALGKNRVRKKHIRELRRRFDDKGKTELLTNSKSTTSWVYDVIKEISEDENVRI